MGVNFCTKCEVSFNDDASMYCNCHPIFLCSVGHPNLMLANRVVRAPNHFEALRSFTRNYWVRGVLEGGVLVGEHDNVYVISGKPDEGCLRETAVFYLDGSGGIYNASSIRMNILPGALSNWEMPDGVEMDGVM